MSCQHCPQGKGSCVPASGVFLHSPALQSDPADDWKISIGPMTLSPPKTILNSQMFVCLFWQEEKGPNLSLGKCVTHPSSGIVAPAGKAVPHFLALSVNEVVNVGKALGQQKALATYPTLLLQSFRASSRNVNFRRIHGLTQFIQAWVLGALPGNLANDSALSGHELEDSASPQAPEQAGLENVHVVLKIGSRREESKGVRTSRRVPMCCPAYSHPDPSVQEGPALTQPSKAPFCGK